jgi:hypothetical protein
MDYFKQKEFRFTLEIFYKNKYTGLERKKYYCGVCTIGRTVTYSTSKDRNCAKVFKSIASAKGVATRLMKKHNITAKYVSEIIGYDIRLLENNLV